MGKRTDISVEEAAEIMQKDSQYIRYGLRNGALPFGSAVQKPDGRYSYDIAFSAFCEYRREPEEKIHKKVELIRKEKERKRRCKYIIERNLQLEQSRCS